MMIRQAIAVAVTLVALMGADQAWALNGAVPFVQADYMWAQGYTGSGVEVAIIDLFLADSTHPALSGNFLGNEKFSNGAAFMGSHATQVAGTFASQNATYKGVSPGVGWWTGQTTNPGKMTKQRTQTVAVETFGQGLRGLNGNPAEVITLSIGLGGTSTGTDQWSLALDHVVASNGRTITISAGNNGPGSGTISGAPTGTYNTILVGATGDALRNFNVVASFSSRGPTDDGRAKPDIIAPGVLLHLPTLSGAWSDVSGTSFSAPMVAGGAALLIDMGQTLGHSTDPKVIKTILLNSADKLAGWSHTTTSPLDPSQGAGQMNLQRAHDQYAPAEQSAGAVAGVGWDLGQATIAGETFYAVDGIVSNGATLTATLNWNRIISTDVEDIDDVIYSVDHFDNLDLAVYDADDLSTPLAMSVSTVDNVEHIVFTAPASGRYTLGVKLLAGSPDGLEDYALAWNVATSALIAGDANFDGQVDLQDFSLLKANFGATTGALWSDGDFNADGAVNLQDFSLLKANFGTAAEGENIPEPATLSLMATGVLVLLKRKRNA